MFHVLHIQEEWYCFWVIKKDTKNYQLVPNFIGVEIYLHIFKLETSTKKLQCTSCILCEAEADYQSTQCECSS